MKQRRSRLTDTENILVVTCREREVGRGILTVGEKEKFIMGLYEIMYVTLLKIVTHHRI